MREAWVVAPRQVEIREVPVPKVQEGGVLVKIKAAGVCGSDIGMFTGEHPFRTPPSMLGHEMSGEIVEVGAGVSEYKVGDRIAFNPIVNCGHCDFCKQDIGNLCGKRQIAGADGSSIQGTFADYIAVPATHICKIADHVSFDCGALVEPISVAMHALKRFTGPKDTMLLYGTGVIGLCSLLLAKDMGYKRVYCTNRGAYNRELAMKLGATAAFNPNEVDVPKVLRELEPEGINACVLSVANEKIIGDVMDCMRPRGEICYAYQNTKPVPTNFCPLVNNEFTIFGTTGETMNDFRESADFVNRNTELVQHLITHVKPLSKAAEAVAQMMSREEPAIKVLVHPEED